MSISEIRVNRITHTTGVGTVTTNADGMIVTGIVTAASFSGDGANLTGVSGLGTALSNSGILKDIFYFDTSYKTFVICANPKPRAPLAQHGHCAQAHGPKI